MLSIYKHLLALPMTVIFLLRLQVRAFVPPVRPTGIPSKQVGIDVEKASFHRIPNEREAPVTRRTSSRESRLPAVSFLSAENMITISLPLPEQSPPDTTLNPLEAWCLSHLDEWYRQSQSVKCPFLRRRWGDLLDDVEMVMKYTIIRPECWPYMGPPQAWRPAGHNVKRRDVKYKGLSLAELEHFVLNDWKAETGKGYYVTGRLTTEVYRDDCAFVGPDPDMPIRGLRKYVGVAAHLFDSEESCAALESLEQVGDTLKAHWHLEGILRLPWRPNLSVSGSTVYHVDKDGLIALHEESWDISVANAFCHTFFPSLAERIWKPHPEQDTSLKMTL